MDLPNQGLFFELLRAAIALVQALPGKSREFNFRPVEPETVFGDGVKRALVAQLPDPFNGPVLVKSPIGMDAAAVLYQLRWWARPGNE